MKVSVSCLGNSSVASQSVMCQYTVGMTGGVELHGSGCPLLATIWGCPNMPPNGVLAFPVHPPHIISGPLTATGVVVSSVCHCWWTILIKQSILRVSWARKCLAVTWKMAWLNQANEMKYPASMVTHASPQAGFLGPDEEDKKQLHHRIPDHHQTFR